MFLCNGSITAVVDSHCSSLKSINIGVPQDFTLSSTFFILFINNLLYKSSCPIYSNADDTTYTFPRLFRDDQPFRKLIDHAGRSY